MSVLPRIAMLLYLSLLPCIAEQPYQISTQRPRLDGGAWVLSGAWAGYEGIAIKFRTDGTFRYWAYVDVNTDCERKYPIRGTWRWKGAMLELSKRECLKDTLWYVVRYRGRFALISKVSYDLGIKDNQSQEDWLLFRITNFDERHPSMNYGGFERRDGTIWPISP